MSNKNHRIPPKALRDLWAQVPSIDCKGLCSNSCGPIGLSQMEARLIEDRARKKVESDERMVCSMLKNGRCTVYSIRPLICRLWGVTESMPCPHGCKPERTLTDKEGFALMAEAERLSGDKMVADDMLRGLARFTEDPELHAAFREFVGAGNDFGGNVLEQARTRNQFVEVLKRKGYG